MSGITSGSKIAAIENKVKEALKAISDYRRDVESANYYASKALVVLLEEIEEKLSSALESAEGYRRLTGL